MRTRINTVRVVLPGSVARDAMRLLAVGALVAIAIAGCGAGASGGGVATSVSTQHAARAAAVPALPVGWGRLRLRSGAVLPYPASWRKLRSDPGSASAALLDRDGTIRAYLNATPADGHETLAGWARFSGPPQRR